MKDFEKKILREAEQAEANERDYLIQTAIKTTDYLLDLIKNNRYREGSKARFLIPEHELFKFFNKDRLEFFNSELFVTLVMMRCQNDNHLEFKRGGCIFDENRCFKGYDGLVVTFKDGEQNDCTSLLYVSDWPSDYGTVAPSVKNDCIDFLVGYKTYSIQQLRDRLGYVTEVIIDSTCEEMPACLRDWLPCTDKTEVMINANYTKPEKPVVTEESITEVELNKREFSKGFLITVTCLLVAGLLIAIN